MKKILVSFGLILTLVLCCALVPVNAAEECAHEKVTFQYFLEGQSKPTTCAESGIAKYTCDACKVAVYKKEVGKHVVDYVVEDATCTKAQKVTEKCTVCKTVLSETVVAEALGHDFVETLIEASCESAAGVAAKCSRCDEKKDFAPFEEGHELYAPAKGHKWDEGKVVAPTCKEGGYTLQTCANCKATQKVNKTEADKVNGHKAVRVAVLKEATCKTNGIGKFACELCKEELGYASIAASHKWDEENMIIVEAATCAKDGKATLKCIACDAKKENVVIAATGEHTWEDVVLGETCTEGSKVGKQCSVCKKAELVAVEGSVALGHDWEEKLIEASCEKGNGVKRVCKRCEAAETEYFAETDPLYEGPTGHKTIVTIPAVAPTCVAKGSTEGSYCKDCEKTLVEPQEVAIDANAHTAVLVATLKEATCKANGVGKYACKDCPAELGYKSIAVAHKWGTPVAAEGKAPTCAKEGFGTYTCTECGTTKEAAIEKLAHTFVNTTFEKCGEKTQVIEVCSVCEAKGKVVSTSEKVKEHNWANDIVVEATCRTAGFVGKICLDCLAHEILQVYEEALGHDWKEELVEATCEKPNGVKRICKREDCKEEEVEYFTEGNELYEAALGHTVEKIPAVAPTCVAKGSTEGSKCTVCEKTLVEPQEVAVDANAHTPELVDTLKEATCTTNGVGKYACKDCPAQLGYKSIKASHKLGELVVDEAATCTKEGKGHKDCEKCDYVQKDIVIAKADHTYVEKAIDATCTEPAKVGKECSVCKAQKDVVVVEGSEPNGHTLTDSYVAADCTNASGVLSACSVCDYKKLTVFTEADGELFEAALGHTAVEVPAKAPTCAETGLTAGSECSVCGTELVKQEEVAKDANAHTAELVKTLKEATCTTTGVGKYACKDCPAELGYKAIAAGHKLGELVVDEAATCAKAGKGHKNCEKCDYVQKDIVIAATGEHDFVEKAIDATCTEADKVGKECSVCKAQKDVTVVEGSKPNGHDWKETPVDATCTTAAGVNKVCKVCEAKEFVAYTGELAEAAKGHNYEAKVVEGTCKVAGYTAEICKNCKDVRNKVEGTTNPEKHNPTQGAILKEATCTTTGVAKQVCKDCGEGLGYVAVPAGHSFGEETIANEAGTLVYVKCEDCDAIKVVAYFGEKEVAVGTVFASLAKFDEAEKPAEAE